MIEPTFGTAICENHEKCNDERCPHIVEHEVKLFVPCDLVAGSCSRFVNPICIKREIK